jgi:Mrp family chromosome partitioning ATPase
MIITAASLKARVGKSTKALHLAAVFAKDKLDGVSDKRAPFGWEDYERIGKEVERLNG